MKCQCYTIGGPFIAEDPDCPAHGREAQRVRSALEARRDAIVQRIERSLEGGEDLYDTLVDALEFIREV